MQLRSAIVGLALLLPGAVVAQEIEMRVELMGPLDTKTSHKGDRVFARVLQPDGLKGDTVEGVVKEVRSGGKLHGNSVLNFSFETLQHGGQAVPIGTEIRAFRNSKGQADLDEEGRVVRRGGGNTGKVVAGTAAGGMIGGMVHGWKGAAVGTGAGAAASIAVIEITADSPEIRFGPGSIITLSARSHNGPPLSSMTGTPAPSAPVYQPARSVPVYQPAPSYAATPDTSAGVAAAPAPTAQAAQAANPAAGPAAGDQPDFTALKDDFIPGEKIIFYDDFTDMAPDEAPPHWKVRGSAVTLLGSGALRQLNVGYRTTLTPSIKNYPKNFTLEQDMVCGPKGCQFLWDFFSAKDHNNQVLRVSGSTDQESLRVAAKTNKEGLFDTNITLNWHAPIKTAIWLQNGRLRIYYNGQKVGDFNQLELPDLDYAYMVVNMFGEGTLGFTRVRFAESTPDFSHAIMSAGRYVTTGILFDTGSDHLKPESAAVIKSIAAGLQANADLKVKIEGHTDSTGAAALNLDLSKRRAAAVKQVLVAEFQIDAARMTTEGLGATKPLEPNDTPQGRAQNRRVEFVKE